MVLIFSIEEWVWDFGIDKYTVLLAPDLRVSFFVGLSMAL